MKTMKFMQYLFMFILIYSCKSINHDVTTLRDNSRMATVYRYVHEEYRIDTSFYNNEIQNGYGILSGYVIFNRFNDTVIGLDADITKTYLHVLDTNFSTRVDGEFNLLLPVGNYKICIDPYGCFPVVNEVKIRNKEEQRINYYIDGKWID